MADAAAAQGSTASVFKRPWLKPEIYNTADSKVIVEDEFINLLSQDKIECIESSKKGLFELFYHTAKCFS